MRREKGEEEDEGERKEEEEEGVFIALHKCLLASSLRGRELPTLSHQFLFIVFFS